MTLQVQFRLDFAGSNELQVELLLDRLKLVNDSRQNVFFGRLRAGFPSGSSFSTFSTWAVSHRAPRRLRNVAFPHGSFYRADQSTVCRFFDWRLKSVKGAILGRFLPLRVE